MCGDFCQEYCHSPYICVTCMELCRTSCVHGICKNVSGDRCIHCSKTCEWVCQSFRNERAGSEPCDSEKCLRMCKFNLPCGHLCMGVCPSLCLTCNLEDPAFNIFLEMKKERESFYCLIALSS